MLGIEAKKLKVAVLGGGAGLVLAAGASWACTFQPRFVSLAEQSGPQGSTVAVTGEGVTPGSAVELRWNGVTGLQLASTIADERGAFIAAATVPDVAPEVYSIMVVAKDGVSRAAFEVTPDRSAPTAPPQASAWSGLAPEPGTFSAPSLNVPASSSSDLSLGTALLGVGVVVLASGAGVASVRRRRAPITNTTR